VTSLRGGAAADLAFPSKAIPQTLSTKSPPHIRQTLSGTSETPSRNFKRGPWREENSESPTRDFTRELTDANVGKFSPADTGQMHLDLNYAREHWTQRGENPAVGLLVSSEKNRVVARYALEGLPNKTPADRSLRHAKRLAAEIEKTRQRPEARRSGERPTPRRA